MSVLRLCILFLFTLVIAATFAQEPRNAATSYIERALEQMGGVPRLEAIRTAHVEFWGHRYLLEESEHPDGPWIVAYEKATEFRDYQRGALRKDEEQWGLGSEEGVKFSMTVADDFVRSPLPLKRSPAQELRQMSGHNIGQGGCGLPLHLDRIPASQQIEQLFAVSSWGRHL